MRRLTERELQATINRAEAASAAHLDGDRGAFDRWLDREGNRPARLEFPLGELQNEAIRGYVWAWKMRGLIATAGLSKGDGFAAQGLEGKAVIGDLDLVSAVLAARELPLHRRAVFTLPKGTS